MRQHSKGFTLLEVMIVVAIIGVLAAVAVPQYNVYVKKAKVSEAIEITHEVKAAMTQYYFKARRFPPNYGDWARRNAEVGLRAPSTYESEVIDQMWLGSRGVIGADNTSGHIAITLNPDLKLGLNGSGNAMLLSTMEANSRGGMEFICGNTSSIWRTTVDPKYLPGSCQN